MKKNIIDVVAAILCCDEKVLVGKRMKGDTNAGRWEFPGGKIKHGESAQEALQREIMEELGVAINQFSFFDQVKYEYPQYGVNIGFYTAKVKPDIRFLSSCHDEIRWIAPKDAQAMDFLDANRSVLKKLTSL